ncbi:heavy metal translocating P-type ATPase [Bacillus sp. FJAT-47783]|uniref:heavy metal translocating P-type ATPase n=1 Tax=Bacillus sp. FJAT-47783 TaxID=2922712 RepID=UPI001FAE637B|nr:heavy metal translocating P-type ATPase [Bacillus sp. FJAT-47783]
MNEKITGTNEEKEKPFFKEHGELIAAITSGILIIAAWLFHLNGVEPASVSLYLAAFVIGGFAKAKEGIEETIENKKLNVELLMVFAAIGSAIIGYWAEGAILIFIFALSGALETYTSNKSQRELSSLMELQPETATLIANGEEKIVHVSELVKGDPIIVKPGERIPADGVVIQGRTSVDESAITGEAVPVEKNVNEEVFAGTVNVNGSITVEVTKENTESLFQKILELVQLAQSEKSPSQQFIEKFESTYVNGVMIAVLLLMVIPHFVLGWTWEETFYRAMVFMVVASPCALVASIMPATLSAISNGARNGLLFKGGVHLERLSKVKVIGFDKTGTLTKGEPVVTDFIIREGADKQLVLEAVYLIEKQSNHPLAKAIVDYTGQDEIKRENEWISVTEHSGFGVSAEWKGQMWKIGKADFVGREDAVTFQDHVSKRYAEEGKTIVYVRDEKGIVAIFALKDVLREEIIEAIDELQKEGIHTVMLTGDSETTAKAIAREAGIDEFHSECLPEDKVERVKQLKKDYGIVAMIGDGINDAPALATANIGIAMGEGTDAALETAEIVLMKNDMSKVMNAIKLSKKMNRIIKQNIIFSLAVIAVLICSNFLQIIDLPYGVIGHEGSTILVILNGLRLLKS